MISEDIVIQTDGNGKKIQKYIKKQVIGTGGFAKCYLMINTRTKQKFAGKVIRKKQLRDKSSHDKVMQQIQIHKSTNHNSIVKLYDMFDFQGEIYIIMELCQNNSLKQFLKNRVRLTELQVKCYIIQILNGIQYLHQNNILHRDIKLGNIFLNYKMEIKIGDFGLSTKLKNPRQKRYTTCGTPNYIAPQILSESGHSFEVDIWAVGIITYALLIGKPPFQSETVDKTYQRIKNNEFEFPRQAPISNQAKNLIKSLLQPNPRYRLTIEQIKNHEFFTKNVIKIPEVMPPYTISIPPQNNYLKQYISQKHMKLSIFPRRISNTNIGSDECTLNINTKAKNYPKQKLARVLSLDKNIFKSIQICENEKSKSTLNRGHIYNSRLRIHTQSSFHQKKDNYEEIKSSRKQIELFESKAYQKDTCEIICYYDMRDKYGLGYLLSNGNYGVIYNDSTSLTKLQNRNCYMYFQRKQTKLEVLPPNLFKKSEILEICNKKLANYKQKNITIPFESDTYAKKYIKCEQFFVIKLSNGILQFFWSEDTITLRGYKYIKWKIGRSDGQNLISCFNLPKEVEDKVEIVKSFLKDQCEKQELRKMLKTQSGKSCYQTALKC